MLSLSKRDRETYSKRMAGFSPTRTSNGLNLEISGSTSDGCVA